MKRRKINQKRQWEFTAKVEKVLTDLGASYDGEVSYPFALNTVVGLLRMGISTEGTMLWVFGVFSEPARASNKVACNFYSGKWNHFCDGCAGIDSFVENLRCQVAALMPSEGNR